MIFPSLNNWIEQNASALDAVILDIDGVLLNSGRRLPGSRHLLALLDRLCLPYLFLTNDGNHSTQEKAQRLELAGLTVTPAQIVSCGHAIDPLVKKNGLSGQSFFIMGDTGRPCYAETAGLVPVRDLKQLKDCTGVIIGEENYPWEQVINAVVNFFIDTPDAPLIVPNPDEFYPSRELKIHIAAGGVARFIQHVLDAYGLPLEPIYLGKPYKPIFHIAIASVERQKGKPIDSNKILMVGDNIDADIAGGRQVGFRTALVLTGVTAPAALEIADIEPDFIFKAL